jgi:NTE family protein
MNMATNALVLGGGGPVGRAWLAGLLSGLRAEGVDLGRSDLVVGTSAGAIVGAQFLLGMDIAAIVANEVSHPGPAYYTPEAMARLGAILGDVAAADSDQDRAAIGAKSLAADTISEDEFLARPAYTVLTGQPWPEALRITAVSVTTGKLAVWAPDSGVDLGRAAASTSSLPGISPAVTINGDRYMDGGMRSMLNADLVAGARSAVVVSCFSLALLGERLTRELDTITDAGGTRTIVEPGAELLALTDNGARMLDPTLIPDALQVGLRQAAIEAPRLGQ